jgi:uncharacterized protein YutE (UPF0331/DUF86 family)
LSKGFGQAVSEYRQIARRLIEKGVIPAKEGEYLMKMAGYRNRMVHFYQDITPDEVYQICRTHLGEIRIVVDAMIKWVGKNARERE